MEFSEIVSALVSKLPFQFTQKSALQIAEKLLEKPHLFHDWKVNRIINNKLVTFEFTISMGKVNIAECPGVSLVVQNITTGELWIVE